MVQNEEKNSLFKKVLAAIKPVDQALNNIQSTATPVWTNLDKLIDLYMSGDFRAIAISRISASSDHWTEGWKGDFGFQDMYTSKGQIDPNAYEKAIQKELDWLMDYDGKEKINETD